jgi:hypothetical protein
MSEDIRPFLNHLTNITLDKLMDLSKSHAFTQREDLETQILPTLFPFTYALSWLPTILLDSVRIFLHPRLNQLKAQLLDSKSLSIRQLFKLFNRTESSLRATFKLEEL